MEIQKWGSCSLIAKKWPNTCRNTSHKRTEVSLFHFDVIEMSSVQETQKRITFVICNGTGRRLASVNPLTILLLDALQISSSQRCFCFIRFYFSDQTTKLPKSSDLPECFYLGKNQSVFLHVIVYTRILSFVSPKAVCFTKTKKKKTNVLYEHFT